MSRLTGEVWREYRQLEEDADGHVDVAKQHLEALEELSAAQEAGPPGAAVLHVVQAVTSGLLAIASRLEALTYVHRATQDE